VTNLLSEGFVGLLHAPTRHLHGDPADHHAGGRAGRGEWDPNVGVMGKKLVGVLWGWGRTEP